MYQLFLQLCPFIYKCSMEKIFFKKLNSLLFLYSLKKGPPSRKAFMPSLVLETFFFKWGKLREKNGEIRIRMEKECNYFFLFYFYLFIYQEKKGNSFRACTDNTWGKKRWILRFIARHMSH